MKPYGEVVRLIRLTVSGVWRLYFGAPEVMPVESGTEHGAGQIVGVIELQHHMAVGMEQGRVTHAHRDVSVAETDVAAAQRIDTRGHRQTHEREHRPPRIRHLRQRTMSYQQQAY